MKGPTVEAEHEENPRSGSDKKPSMLKTGTAKKNLAESSCSSVLDSIRPPVKVGGPHPYGWKDIWLKVLIPLQSLMSCFLEPPENRQAAAGAIEGLWQELLPSVSQRFSYLLCLTSCCPSG